MLTVTQIAAILMLLNAFGVAPSVVSQVQYELTHPGAKAPSSVAGNVVPTGNAQADGVAGVGQAANPQDAGGGQAVAPSPALCVVSGRAQANTAYPNLYLIQSQFNPSATVKLTYNGTQKFIPAGALAAGNYGFQAQITASTTFALNVDATGYTSSFCSTTI